MIQDRWIEGELLDDSVISFYATANEILAHLCTRTQRCPWMDRKTLSISSSGPAYRHIHLPHQSSPGSTHSSLPIAPMIKSFCPLDPPPSPCTLFPPQARTTLISSPQSKTWICICSGLVIHTPPLTCSEEMFDTSLSGRESHEIVDYV